MEYEITRWYDERRTVTRVQGFESAVQEYNKTDAADTVQLYLKYNGTTILLAQKECQGRRNNLPNLTFLLNTHSCLATNKQILLKDEIKQYKLFSKVWRCETVSIALYSYMHLLLQKCISLNIQRKRQNINKHKTAEL